MPLNCVADEKGFLPIIACIH